MPNMRHGKTKTGQQKWVVTSNSGDLLSPPALANGVIYVSSSQGKFYAFDAKTGRQKWNASICSAQASPTMSPIIANGIIYITLGNTHSLFDATTGQQIRTIQVKGWQATDSSPMVANGMIYVELNNSSSSVARLYACGVIQR